MNAKGEVGFFSSQFTWFLRALLLPFVVRT